MVKIYRTPHSKILATPVPADPVEAPLGPGDGGPGVRGPQVENLWLKTYVDKQ